MIVRQLACSSNPAGVRAPTWDQIEEAIDRWDDSIWLEGEGVEQLCANRVDFVAMGLDPADFNMDRQAWLVVILNVGNSGASLNARYRDTDYLPPEIAKAAIRSWLESPVSLDTQTSAGGGPWRWV